MNFDPRRMLVLSGLADESETRVLAETRGSSNNQLLVENEIRKIVREEIEAFLVDRNEKSISDAFNSQSLTGAMFPSFNKPQSTKSRVSRGPGRSLGFLGPGFR